MPASTKKVTAKRQPTAAALEKGVAKVRAAHAAKAAKAKPATRKGPKLLADLMNKPFRDARNAKTLRTPAEVAKAAAKPGALPEIVMVAEANAKRAAYDTAKAAKPAATGAKAKILDMIAREKGTSAAEVCKALGWVRAGATIGRAIKLATFKVRKERDADGVLRYYAA
jgi:hypothetical protein